MGHTSSGTSVSPPSPPHLGFLVRRLWCQRRDPKVRVCTLSRCRSWKGVQLDPWCTARSMACWCLFERGRPCTLVGRRQAFWSVTNERMVHAWSRSPLSPLSHVSRPYVYHRWVQGAGSCEGEVGAGERTRRRDGRIGFCMNLERTGRQKLVSRSNTGDLMNSWIEFGVLPETSWVAGVRL